jgi:predicted DNA-binding protein
MANEIMERDGIIWVEIGKAAKLSRTKAAIIRDAIEAGSILSVREDESTFIPATAVKRFQRESRLMAQVQRMNRKRELPPAGRYGLQSDQTQDVLPMSSGRGGRGWKG